jgi:hypothetical protein
MSLAIVFKGSEGVVLAADSRVTLTVQSAIPGAAPIALHASYDNATKLLKVVGHTLRQSPMVLEQSDFLNRGQPTAFFQSSRRHWARSPA